METRPCPDLRPSRRDVEEAYSLAHAALASRVWSEGESRQARAEARSAHAATLGRVARFYRLTDEDLSGILDAFLGDRGRDPGFRRRVILRDYFASVASAVGGP